MQDADEHIRFIEILLSIFAKCFDNVVALIGENCATNKTVVNKTKHLLNGCLSHRFQLTVNKVIAESIDVAEDVQRLIVKHITPLIMVTIQKSQSSSPS